MLETLKQFLDDNQAWDMFVTGRAGTGKTTGLATSVQYCIDNDIPYVVCAFTHKACSILQDKLPHGALIQTLHSWLKKRPSINTNATKREQIDITSRFGDSLKPRIVFIDEYSMVGEQDLMDIRAMQDSDYDAIPEVKVCWLGDPHQLPPVGDMQSVRPFGQYAITLTKVYRQADDNPLKDTLDLLIDFIEGKQQPYALPSHATLKRDVDIVSEYKACTADKVMLAYTNRRVEELNRQIQGYAEPMVHDTVFSPTTKQRYVYLGLATDVKHINKPFGDELHLNTKFKTLEYLLTLGYPLVNLVGEDGEEYTFAIVFGHYAYREQANELKRLAAASNLAIESQFKGTKAAVWAKAHAQEPLARRRAKAWRDFLTFDECVICLDFPHAMTVHKSQGSTYSNVFIDGADLSLCSDFNLYLRLMYVAVSRASKYVAIS